MMFRTRAGSGALAFAAFTALALSGSAARAQGTMTARLTAPTTDSNDVFQAIISGNGGGDNYTDKPAPGQRFTTTATGGQLLSLTVKGNGVADDVEQLNWQWQIASISGTTLTPLRTEIAPGSQLNFNDNGLPSDRASYITYTFATPVTLAPLTTYAFRLYTENGYFGLAGNDAGTGGSFNSTGGIRSFGSNTVAFNGGTDRAFFANISGGAAVPEPGTLALGLMGMVGFAPLAARRLRAARRK